jgi:hypothetical protein
LEKRQLNRERKQHQKEEQARAAGEDVNSDAGGLADPTVYVLIPKEPGDVEKLRDSLYTYMSPALVKEHPLFAAWLNCTPTAGCDDLMQPIIHHFMLTHPELDRRQVAETIATLATAVADSGDKTLDADVKTSPKPARRKLLLDFNDEDVL